MLLDALFYILSALLDLFWWAVVLAVVMNLLVAFQVLDTRNRFVWTVGDFLHRVTEPALRPIRRRLPNLGGVDLSPLVLLILITAAGILLYALRRYMMQAGVYF
ncbi:MAG: YggT family protein [Acetobacteraceae bacterium]|nr:YggT family protein [Acetobacteraceae bacterium]MCX7684755.1 YggT family protein [Acetobacteraceae bacterium]MDW8397746.1 YggT family protein [Acetobacteraceae bacterium]